MLYIIHCGKFSHNLGITVSIILSLFPEDFKATPEFIYIPESSFILPSSLIFFILSLRKSISLKGHYSFLNFEDAE